MSAKVWSPASLASDHKRVAIDSNVLIYLLEGNEEFGIRARAVVDALDDGVLLGSMATVGQVEILAGPARVGDASVFEQTAGELRSMGLNLVALTSDVAEDAAWLRGLGGLALADAVHLASARAAGATAFITNDRRIGSQPRVEVFYLDDLVLEDPAAA